MTDPHAKRRQADGRNSWRKLGLTPGAREQFVRWMLENGLPEALNGMMTPATLSLKHLTPAHSRGIFRSPGRRPEDAGE